MLGSGVGSGVDLRHLWSGVRRETAALIQLRGITNGTGATVNLALAHEYYEPGTAESPRGSGSHLVICHQSAA